MAKQEKPWDFLPEEQRNKYVNEIISYFEVERNEKIGVIAAEEILDFMLETIGPRIYNKAIDDTKTVLKQKFEDINVDLNLLFRE